MDVIVHCRNRSLPSSLGTMTRRKLDRLERVARGAQRAEVEFVEERNPRIAGRHVCAVTVHLPHGIVTAHAAAAEPEVALDLVVDKLRHRVLRIKDRRVRRTHAARPSHPRANRAS
jgi:ribosomal subunit interface protein